MQQQEETTLNTYANFKKEILCKFQTPIKKETCKSLSNVIFYIESNSNKTDEKLIPHRVDFSLRIQERRKKALVNYTKLIGYVKESW